MKLIFKNKGYITAIIAALLLSMLFGLCGCKGTEPNGSMSSDIISQNQEIAPTLQEEAAAVDAKTEPEISVKTETVKEPIGDPQNTEKPFEPVINEEQPEQLPEQTPDNVVDVKEGPIIENKFVKITTDSVALFGLEFNDYSVYDGGNNNYRQTTDYVTDRHYSIEIDSENNKIYYILLHDETAAQAAVKAKSNSDTDLKAKAEEIALELGADLDRYNNYKSGYDEFGNEYYVSYSRTIFGYSTPERVSVYFDSDLNFCRYSCSPNVIDGIDVTNLVIDEQAIIKKANDELYADTGYSYGDRIPDSFNLTVKDSKIIMQLYYVNKNSCAIAVLETEIP